MDKIWQVAQVNATAIDGFKTELNIHESILKLLLFRDVNNFKEAQSFFRPSMQNLHDPFLMKGMQTAVDRVIKAIQHNEKILLYGDYDVDGTTAVAVVFNFLIQFTQNIEYYIPNRFSEGYGISAKGIEYAIEEKFQLIISLDCGIKSAEHVLKANENNIEVIICDHHLPDDNLPKALAILNPKQNDCPYPFKELCGCGIGYKLISALENTMLDEQNLCNQNLDLVATAIAADIVPIVGENRILAYWGLEKANNNPSIAIAALKKAGDLKTNFTITDLVFIVAPRVNAAGRMDDAKKAVQLFLSDNIIDAAEKAQALNIDNADRKDIDKQMTAEGLEMLKAMPAKLKSTVLYKEDWHKGVVGIVASRMIENKYQPTIILTKSNEKITGSARSIPGLNLFDALSNCAEYLETFGGHYFAAGLTLKEENLEPFKIKFNETVDKILQPEDYIPKLKIDAEINLNLINEKYYAICDQLSPHGPENMKPVFVAKKVRNFKNSSSIVKEKHVKFCIHQDGGQMLKGIGFNMVDKFEIINSNQDFDVCFTLEINTWQGISNIEIRVLDICKSA
jgi:single-stranded-DNA-specific exonuclease